MNFTPQELWNSMGTIARLVLFTLLVMSVASIYVAIERWFTFHRARKQSRLLAAELAGPLSAHDVKAARALVEDAKFRLSYLGHLVGAGLKELGARFDRPGLAAAGRAMERAMLVEALDLRKGTAILATVGSTAPFVGLVGTVFGIINAFAGMAESGSGGLASVSAGIAEALVTTAVGIAVAIVGVWLFNYFNSRVEVIQNDMTISTQEFMDWGEKAVLDREENPALSTEDARTEPVAPASAPEQA